MTEEKMKTRLENESLPNFDSNIIAIIGQQWTSHESKENFKYHREWNKKCEEQKKQMSVLVQMVVLIYHIDWNDWSTPHCTIWTEDSVYIHIPNEEYGGMWIEAKRNPDNIK